MTYEEACFIVSHCNLIKTLGELGVSEQVSALAGQMLVRDFGHEEAVTIHHYAGHVIERINEALEVIQLAHTPTSGSTN
jgi:hypothetical protein